ncbi:hypothetical protein [Phormidium tenue]|uniref:hypothetical protein n=1 Tax=Phormidium tenue TaxID=126344 RepID=UPI0015C56510|nr:hypothetical protein [Phormidium tenue FACHB-1052]
MVVMDEATAKRSHTISHATKHLRLNIGTVNIGRVAGYAHPVPLPHGLIPIDLQAMVSATVICAGITDEMSVLALQTVVLAVHAARLQAVDPADGDNV